MNARLRRLAENRRHRMGANGRPVFGLTLEEVASSTRTAMRLEKDGIRDRTAERDHYIRLFNRLDAAITHHAKAKADLFVDEADEALYAARAKILSDAARGSGCNDRG